MSTTDNHPEEEQQTEKPEKTHPLHKFFSVIVPSFVSIVSVVVACSALEIQKSQERIEQYQLNATYLTSKPNVSLKYSYDKRGEENTEYISRIDIVSKGEIASPVSVTVYPYLQVLAQFGSGTSADGEWSVDGTSERNYFVPIMPAYDFYQTKFIDAKNDTVASILPTDYTESLIDSVGSFAEYELTAQEREQLKSHYGDDSIIIKRVSLECFVSVEYEGLLGVECQDIYHIETGITEGMDIAPNGKCIYISKPTTKELEELMAGSSGSSLSTSIPSNSVGEKVVKYVDEDSKGSRGYESGASGARIDFELPDSTVFPKTDEQFLERYEWVAAVYDYYNKNKEFSFRYVSGKETSLEYRVNGAGSESLWFSIDGETNGVCYKLIDAVYAQHKLSGEEFFE